MNATAPKHSAPTSSKTPLTDRLAKRGATSLRDLGSGAAVDEKVAVPANRKAVAA